MDLIKYRATLNFSPSMTNGSSTILSSSQNEAKCIEEILRVDPDDECAQNNLKAFKQSLKEEKKNQ
jgi:hypothetical protein